MVFSDVLMVGDEGSVLGLAQGPEVARHLDRVSRKERLRALLLHNYITVISALVRGWCLDEVGWFDERVTGGMDDYELCLTIVASYEIGFVDEPLATHRVHAANYSGKTERLVADAPRIMEKALEEDPFLGDLKARKLAVHDFRLARYHRDVGNPVLTREQLRRAIACDPSWVEPYMSYALCRMGGSGGGCSGCGDVFADSEQGSSSCVVG